ncbi:MAG: tetratricopeptide repeat protein [bacterium]
MEYLQNRLSRNPYDLESHLELGKIFLSQDSLYLSEDLIEKAIAEFEQVISIDPRNIKAYMLVSKALQNKLNPDLTRAAHLLQKTTELAPNYADAHLNLAHIYYEINEEDKAIYEFKQTLQLSNDPYTLLSAHLGLMAIYKNKNLEKYYYYLEEAREIIGPQVDEWIKQVEKSGISQLNKSLPILREALAEARSNKDISYHVNTLLYAAEIIENIDTKLGGGLLEEAIVLVSETPQGPSFWEVVSPWDVLTTASELLDFFSPSSPYSFINKPRIGSAPWILNIASYTSGQIQLWQQHYQLKLLENLQIKDVLTFKLIQLLASKNPSRAFDLALSINDDRAQAVAIDTVLHSWSKEESKTLISKVRILAAGIQSPMILAALASGTEFHDISLARELAHRSLETFRYTGDGLTAAYFYHTLARIDSEAARKVVIELTTTSPVNDALLIAFAGGVTPVQPELAWLALKALDKHNEKLLDARAAILRQLATVLPPHLRDEVRDFALELLTSVPKPPGGLSRFFGFKGITRDELRRLTVLSDVVVSLGAINPNQALDATNEIAFSEYVVGDLFIRYRDWFSGFPQHILPKDKDETKKLVQNFFPDLVRLDLALSWLSTKSRILTNGEKSFSIVESLNNAFWRTFVYTALRGEVPYFSEEPDPEGIHSHLNRLLAEVKIRWPSAATTIAKAQPADATRTLHRFLEVAEELDKAAVLVLTEKKKSKRVWLEYLPFALTFAGRSFQILEPETAIAAFQKSIKLAEGMPSPAREWALCWNAAAWMEVDPQKAGIEGKKVTTLAAGLKNHKPWDSYLPRLVHQVARLDPNEALKIARSKSAKKFRAYALIAVVTGMLHNTIIQSQ